MPTPGPDNRHTSRLRVAAVGTYPPRQCGIATFTRDLLDSVEPHAEVFAAAIEEPGSFHRYPERVRMTASTSRRSDYRDLADRLNEEADVVSLQHEHGIFGGTDGEYILDFARALRVPLVTTLHTVLRRPSESQRNIVRELAERSARLVVINPRARVPLEHAYGLAGVAVQVIPHGIPDLPLVPPDSRKAAFGLAGRRVVLSFGLLSPSKNLDFAIRALPSVVAADPSVVYVIAGATHPGEIRANGEAYRRSLRDLADELGVSTHVRFIDRFLPAAELGELLLAADVYVVPYQHEEQISSGTLAFALGSGTAVVSTPFWHAQELLAGGCGRLVPFGDAGALAREVTYLLTHDRERDEIRRRAYAATRGMTWPAVGEQYVSIFAEVTEASRSRSGRAAVMAG